MHDDVEITVPVDVIEDEAPADLSVPELECGVHLERRPCKGALIRNAVEVAVEARSLTQIDRVVDAVLIAVVGCDRARAEADRGAQKQPEKNPENTSNA